MSGLLDPANNSGREPHAHRLLRQTGRDTVQPRQRRRRSSRLFGRGAGDRHARHETGQFPEPARSISHDRVAVESAHHLRHLREAFGTKVVDQPVNEPGMVDGSSGMKTLKHETTVHARPLHCQHLRSAEPRCANRLNARRHRGTPAMEEGSGWQRGLHRCGSHNRLRWRRRGGCPTCCAHHTVPAAIRSSCSPLGGPAERHWEPEIGGRARAMLV